MIQYLIILLDDTSTSYCHSQNDRREHKLISIEDLKAGIFFAMKDNLMIQYVLPEYELPVEYKEVMNTIDSHLIVPSTCEDENALEAADVIVFNSWKEIVGYSFEENLTYIIRISKADLFEQEALIKYTLRKVTRLNVVITDIENFKNSDFDNYKSVLTEFINELKKLLVDGKTPQLNLITDRMMLNQMNNCNAGIENITLAPDGKFYICPAFYYAGACNGAEESQVDVCKKGFSIGSLSEGLCIKNPQLYEIDHSLLCRNCDAYQCKRCIWLNRLTTCEVNTPGHEQCVVSHLERNASKELLESLDQETAEKYVDSIPKLDYLDPFDNRKEWQH